MNRIAGAWLVGLSLVLGLPAQAAEPAELAPFRSDGCSLFPNGTPVNPRLWCGCCVAHDLAYWQGGSQAERRQADIDLHNCVKAAADSQALAALMRAGVRAGGVPQLPSPFRWGWGWPIGRGYNLLTDAEKERVGQRLAEHSYLSEMKRICMPTPKAAVASASPKPVSSATPVAGPATVASE